MGDTSLAGHHQCTLRSWSISGLLLESLQLSPYGEAYTLSLTFGGNGAVLLQSAVTWVEMGLCPFPHALCGKGCTQLLSGRKVPSDELLIMTLVSLFRLTVD